MDDLLTTEEAAAALGVNDSRIRQLVGAGTLGVARRIRGAILVRREDVERYQRERRPRGRPPKPAPAEGTAGPPSPERPS